VAAALIWGFTNVPLKVPESTEIGATLFNGYCFIANGLAHGLFLCVLSAYHESFQWQWMAALAACNLMVVQIFARNAVLHLGLSAAAVWCSIGMGISFAWGTLAFGDHPRELWPTLGGLALLIIGVGMISAAWSIDLTDDDKSRCAGRSESAQEEIEQQKPLLKPKKAFTDSAMKGLLFAIGAGVADGSLVAFYQCLEGPKWSRDIMFSYFGSFGITMIVIGVAVVLASFATDPSAYTKTNAFSLRRVAPGMISGALWAGANSCSILASHFLGMAVSFPLTQTACVFGALAGIFLFNEFSNTGSRQIFAAGLSTMVIGAVLLCTYGQSEPGLVNMLKDVA